jgi:hypothetical protein
MLAGFESSMMFAMEQIQGLQVNRSLLSKDSKEDLEGDWW